MSVRDRFSPSATIGLVGSLAVLLFAVVTLVRWTGPAVALSYRWEPGEVFRDQATIEMAVRTQPSLLEDDVELVTEMTAVTRVTDVDNDGNATLEATVEDVEVVDSNLPVPQAGLTESLSQPQSFVMSPEGLILDSSNPLIGPQGIDQKGFSRGPLLPDEPVAPGDEWEIDFVQEIGIGEGGVEMHADNTVLRYDEVNGVETLIIKSEVSGPIDFTIDPTEIPQGAAGQEGSPGAADLEAVPKVHYTGELSAEGKSWLDPLTGDVLRGEMEARFTISFDSVPGVPQFSTEIDMEIQSQRLP